MKKETKIEKARKLARLCVKGVLLEACYVAASLDKMGGKICISPPTKFIPAGPLAQDEWECILHSQGHKVWRGRKGLTVTIDLERAQFNF